MTSSHTDATRRPCRLLLWPGDTIVILRGRQIELEATILRKDGDVLVCMKDNGSRIRVLLPGSSQTG